MHSERMRYVIKQVDAGANVEALLLASRLPVSDVLDASKVKLFGYVDKGDLLGVVGLEQYGQDALLRSLAVRAAERGGGVGSALVSCAEQYAVEQGVRTMYLLTTTASDFFYRRDYRHLPRRAAPAQIASTEQFAKLCPTSSFFMAKSMGPGD
jgi:amino-acid N-acetyltransferase